ncbi:MAG: imidazolonepropionase [Dehalococcoidia bacterium]
METNLLIEHAAELCTLAGTSGPRRGPQQADLGIVADGAIACGVGGRILAAGSTSEVRSAITLAHDTTVIDATGCAVIPGFVDPHTHAVFAGDRAEEFVQRLEGADYLEILAAGGGILSTVRATRTASPEALLERALSFLDEMLLMGTTAVEIKSGYGLSTESELTMLRVVAALQERAAQTVVPSFLGAHAVPPEYRDDPDGYVKLVCQEMIPAVAAENLARYCDVFCETGVFTVEQSRRVLTAGLAHGLTPKLHAEQKSHLGGTALAAELHAASADHLEHASDEDLQALAAAGTVAVFLPGAAFMLREDRMAPAQRAIELGAPVALATDFNPGTSPILSMPVIIGLACLRLGMTPAEALVATTINAAYAIGLGDETGSLEPRKRTDLLILDAPSHRHLPYYFGRNLVHTVVKDGRLVVCDGQRVAS